MRSFNLLRRIASGAVFVFGTFLSACGGPLPDWQQPHQTSFSPLCLAVASYHQKMAQLLTNEVQWDEKQLQKERILLQNAMIEHPLTARYVESIDPQFSFRPTEWAVAAFSLDEDVRFHWLHLRRFVEKLPQVTTLVDERGSSFLKAAFAEADQLLGASPGVSMELQTVCGGPWAISRLQESTIFIDLSWFVSQPIEKAKESVKQLLTEEAFKAAFRARVMPQWPSTLNHSEPVMQYLVAALEAGTGAYGALRTLGEDASFETEEREIFRVLETKYAEWMAASEQGRAQLLWESQTADFWSRFMAMPVALMMRRLARQYGEPVVVDLLRQDPSALFMAYIEAENRILSWPRLPVDLAADVKKMWLGK